MNMLKVKINGKEYKNPRQACKELGLSYDNFLHHKQRKGNKFKMKLVKWFDITVKD